MRSEEAGTPISSRTRTVSALEVGSISRASTSSLNASSSMASKPRRAYTCVRTCHNSAERFPVITAGAVEDPSPSVASPKSSSSCPGLILRRATSINAANSASVRAVPTCSSTTSRPPLRSAICTFVAPGRPGTLRTNTMSSNHTHPGVCQSRQ